MLTKSLKITFEAAKRFGNNSKGSTAIIFAVALVPVVMLSIGGIQYYQLSAAQSKLNSIADATALSAVSNTAVIEYETSPSTVQSQAQKMFNAQVGLLSGVTVSTSNVAIVSAAATSTASQSITATVTYTASIQSLMPGLLGTSFKTVSGTASASSSLPAYTNFYLLLDDSPSMGIGATPADIAAIAAVNNGCGFACHSPNATPANYPGYTTPYVAGTSLRINAMQSAASQLISTAISSQTVPNQYKIGLYTFNNTVTTVSALSTNLTQVQTDSAAIQLPVTDVGTQIGDAVGWLNSNVVTASSGTGTQSSPFEYVFLVTDGVEDHAFGYTAGSYDTLYSPYGTWNGTNYGSVMDIAACTLLKNKGVTVAVLYTNYDPLGSNVQYNDMVAPFAGNIVSQLTACASPGFFFQADSASQINSAMQQMFATALQKSAHLAQ